MSAPSSHHPGHGSALDHAHARWFAEEVQPHEPALRAYLRAQFPALHDIDDVVQDTYARLFEQQSEGQGGATRDNLFALARHAARKLFQERRLFSETPVSELPEWRVLDGAQDVVNATHARQLDALVTAALDRLPGRCREIFELRVLAGCSYAEIAAQLGISEPTVRVQIARGLQKCAQFMRTRGINGVNL